MKNLKKLVREAVREVLKEGFDLDPEGTGSQARPMGGASGRYQVKGPLRVMHGNLVVVDIIVNGQVVGIDLQLDEESLDDIMSALGR